MIIKRGVKLQLIAFAIITVLGISYTTVRILGLGTEMLDLRYKVMVDLRDSGGIFSNAEVTYRGVAVGRVGPLRLTKDGVRVELRIDRDRKVPAAGTHAYVLQRSGVGEQYVDLRPPRDGAPYLADGDVIPRERTHIPVSTAELLKNVDKLIEKLNPTHLATVIDELDKGLSGTGADLRAILDNQKTILDSADETYPETARLLANGKKVLGTQVESGPAIREFARNLASLTDEVRKGDGDIRNLLNVMPGAMKQGNDLLNELEGNLPVLLANSSVTGQMLTARIPGIRQLLITYPIAVAGGQTPAPGDGTVHFGLELNLNAPPPCKEGYDKTKIRYPQDTSRGKLNKNAGCKAPKNSDIAVRGSRNAPKPQPTIPLPPGATKGTGYPEPRETDGKKSVTASPSLNPSPAPASAKASTSMLEDVYVSSYDPESRILVGPDGKRYRLGSTGGQQLTGDASWQWLLTAPLAG